MKALAACIEDKVKDAIKEGKYTTVINYNNLDCFFSEKKLIQECLENYGLVTQVVAITSYPTGCEVCISWA